MNFLVLIYKTMFCGQMIGKFTCLLLFYIAFKTAVFTVNLNYPLLKICGVKTTFFAIFPLIKLCEGCVQ